MYIRSFGDKYISLLKNALLLFPECAANIIELLFRSDGANISIFIFILFNLLLMLYTSLFKLIVGIFMFNNDFSFL